MRETTTALLKSWALEAGFDQAGVAALEPAAHGAAFVRWLERGDQAGMGYLERRAEARLNPGLAVPGAKSALSVALRYWPLAGEEEPEGDLWPRVARYARGRDYHDLMSERLRGLARRIEEAFPGTVTRPYVDTGPVLERDLAARAGLGAIGKNTNLLNRTAGSWFLLGELLLSLELEPDEPLADLCGRCTLCLDACPTGALPEPYRLDSRRCISYWTIEHRGPLPEEAREMVGDWVFGCDVCQEVCPWNRRSPVARKPADHPEMRLPPARRELDLIGLLTLEREEYVERFRGSPMKRAKLEGLKRNAALAMGNRGEKRYREPLARALEDESSVVRDAAEWALGRIGEEEEGLSRHGDLEDLNPEYTLDYGKSKHNRFASPLRYPLSVMSELLYTAHVPAGEGPFPTLIALHGWGASAHDLLGLAPLLDDGRVLMLCPQGSYGFSVGGGMKGYGWFPLVPGQPPEVEAFTAEAARLRSFVDMAMERYPVDPARLAVAGFSQGGVMAYELALRNSERFAGLAALSSWLPEILAEDLPKKPEQEGLPVLLVHGTEDNRVEVEKARQSRELLRPFGVSLMYREFAMGHEIRPEALDVVRRWLAERAFSGRNPTAAASP